MKLIFVFSILLMMLSGCSTASVRLKQGQNGVNTVFARDIELKDAEDAAHAAAKQHCELRKSNLIVLKEKSYSVSPADPKARYNQRSVTRQVSLVPGRAANDGREYQAGVLFRCQQKLLQAAN
jgi:hypothetical protein